MTDSTSIDENPQGKVDIFNPMQRLQLVETSMGEPLNALKIKEITERTINAAAEFIRSQDEVTLVIPLIGGMPLNVELIQRLIEPEEGVEPYPIKKLNIIYCESRGEGKGKEIFFDSTELKGTAVMLDDTVDQFDTTQKIDAILDRDNDYHTGLVVFAAVVKTSTLEILEQKKIEYVNLKTKTLKSRRGTVVAMGEMIEPLWVHTSLGMHGDSLKLIREGKLEMDRNDAAYFDALQRVSSECFGEDPGSPSALLRPETVEEEIEYLSHHSRVKTPTNNLLVENLRILNLYKDAWTRSGDPTALSMELAHAKEFIDRILSGHVRIDFN